MPRKVFTAGEILTAADVNTNLMDQAVMVFDDASARDIAIPSPVEGMVTYLKDTDNLEKFDGSAFVPAAPGKLLQVVSTTKTDTFTTTSGSFADVTGLSATITPSSTASKILITYDLGTVGASNSALLGFDVARGGTAVGSGTAAGSRFAAGIFLFIETVDNEHSESFSHLDSPASTSALTYQVRCRIDSGKTLFLNRTRLDIDGSTFGRSSSTITLMEVAG